VVWTPAVLITLCFLTLCASVGNKRVHHTANFPVVQIGSPTDFLSVFLFCEYVIRLTDFVSLTCGRYDHNISHHRHVFIVDL